jgi:hypothetical protein
MKKIFLAFLIYTVCINSFAQIETSNKTISVNSEKWEIIKVNAKTSTGKLFVTLPKGTEWDMTIYAAGSNKVISNTSLKTTVSLPPGSYDVEINHIRILGVPVEKGNSTRIKAGVLHITSPDAWTLYDETKQKVLINTYSAQTRGLPVGIYKLTIVGKDQDIEILDEALSSLKNINPTFSTKTLLVDVANNGLVLTNKVQTSLLTGEQVEFKWVHSNSDDAFLTVDADQLRTQGFVLKTEAGALLQNKQILRSGIQVQISQSSTVLFPKSAWELLGYFDNHSDNQIDGVDVIWLMLYLFTDKNANGKIETTEIRPIAGSGIQAISLGLNDRQISEVLFNPIGN